MTFVAAAAGCENLQTFYDGCAAGRGLVLLDRCYRLGPKALQYFRITLNP